MKAQHTTTTTTSSNYQNILNRVMANDPSFVYLDLSELHLTEEQLREIASKIQNNNFIGNINWGTVPPSSDELVQKIESKIVSNNQNYKHHPNDFIHGLFSSYAYRTSKENEKVIFECKEDKPENRAHNEQVKIRNEQLKDWQVHKVFNEPEAGRYYSATYINEKTKQMVLAHRGTTLEGWDLLKTDSPFKTDFKSILGGEIVAQQAMAYQATEEIIKYAKQHGYNLSFTGHSLGAWLAELSLYFAHRDFNYSKAKAITFDSPGSALTIENFRSNIQSYETDFDMRNLDITTYLSAPNFVNVCNPHIHKVYRLFPEITASEHTDKIINVVNKLPLIKNCTPLLGGTLSLAGHLLTPIIDTFDHKTGKPIKYEKVLDWACIKYQPKNDVVGEKAINTLLDFIPGLNALPGSSTIKNVASKLAYKGITATTLGSFLEVIDQFISGNIASEQFWEVYKHLESNASQGYPLKKIISDKGNFDLSYQGHYRTQEVDQYKDVINTDNKGSTDWYLKQLAKLSNEEIEAKEISGLLKTQLKTIKEQYETKPISGKHYIQSTGIKIEDLRDQILRLSEISNEAKKILEDGNAYTPHKLAKVNESIHSNLLPLSVNNLIPREDVLQKIDKTLSTERSVVISAFPGTGKSTIAMEYGYRQKDKPNEEKIVRFINADSVDKISEAYRKLAQELGINVESQTEEIVIRLVHNKIANLKPSILFIFDNVDEYKDIEPYLNDIMNISKNKVQVIITTRDNKLHDDLKNIKLEPFSKEEAITYIEKSYNGLKNQDKKIISLVGNFVKNWLCPNKCGNSKIGIKFDPQILSKSEPWPLPNFG